jgi:mycofactocin biosynthetic radical S-adenosylmethionine protein MftC
MKLKKFRWTGDRVSLLWPDHPLLMAGDKYLEFVVDGIQKNISKKVIASELSQNSGFQFEETNEYVNQISDALQEAGLINNQQEKQRSIEGPGNSDDLAMATLNLTRKCNLQCFHCYAGGGSTQSQKEISNSELPNIIRQLALLITRPPRLLIISGGEPTLEREKLEVAIIEACKYGLDIRLNTNGYFIDNKLADFLARQNVLTQVSLDGLDAKTNAILRGRLDAYDAAIQAINKLVKAGGRTRISFTVHSQNYLQLPSMINFALTLGVEQITTSSLVGLGNALKNNLSAVDFSTEFTVLYDAVKDNKQKQLMTRSTLLAETCMAIRAGIKFTYCGTGCCTCCLDSDGTIYPCINLVKEEFSAGNVLESNMLNIWENSPVLKQLRSLNIDTMNKKCQRCSFRYFCGGYCRGETIEAGKKITDPYVRCAPWKRGLLKIMDFLSETPDLYDLGDDPSINIFHYE